MSTPTTNLLMLKRHSLADWRALAQSTHASQFKRLLRQADTHHDSLPPAEHPSDSITYIGTAVLNLALAHLLTKDRAYLDTARRWIKAAIAYPHWGKERMPDHDLDAAWLLFGLGLGYDWLKNALPPDERAALRDKLIWQTQQLYQFALDSEGSWWSSAYWQNHNWICYGGLATAAYALSGEIDDAARWAQRARDNFAQALAYMPEDGSNYEGPVYWRYGVIWFYIYADLLQQETGENLHQSDFLKNTFFYRLYLSGPNLADTANFGDCHDRRSAHSAALYARVAGLYSLGEAQWLYHHFYQSCEWEREGAEGLVKPGLWAESGLEFLWYDPTVPEAPIEKLPLQRVFPDLGLLSVRSSWQPDATMLAFKCGAPNGIKAWHSGNALNRKRNWTTLNAGHDHPDANSFILIKGDDYIAVDDGYAQAKQTANHSTLLIDGQGQYAGGSKNAFRHLDEAWSARLETTFKFDDLLYARGEAARAYDKALDLRQFTREILVLGGDALVINDTISAGTDHEYQWLLQTDSSAAKQDNRTFTIAAGQTTCALHALQPDNFAYQISEQEITANPTSAKPDWIIRRLQHTLALMPSEPCKDCRFLVILNMADYAVESVPAQRGIIADLTKESANWRIGFSKGRDGILTDDINIDGNWFAGLWQRGRLAKCLAGDVASIWLDGELQLIADRPLDIALCWSAKGIRAKVTANDSAWIRFKSFKPERVSLNGRDDNFHYDDLTGMVWVLVRAGKTEIVVS